MIHNTTFIHPKGFARMINSRLYVAPLAGNLKITLSIMNRYADLSNDNFRQLSIYIKEDQR